MTTVHQVYSQLLRWHNKGRALWEPPRSETIRVLSLGYFDKSGRWNELVPDIQDVPNPLDPFPHDVERRDEDRERIRSFESSNWKDLTLKLGVTVGYTPLPFRL